MMQTESKQKVAKMTDKHAAECSKVAYLGANLSMLCTNCSQKYQSPRQNCHFLYRKIFKQVRAFEIGKPLNVDLLPL